MVDLTSTVSYKGHMKTSSMLTRRAREASDAIYGNTTDFALLLGSCYDLLATMKPNSVDLIVSSPPYFIGKEYDRSRSVNDFIAEHKKLAPLLEKVLKPGGSLCWQTGNHTEGPAVIPLDILAFQAFESQKSLQLRNRIVWHFEHGLHAKSRFSGRHETILWYTKGENYTFNLDAVRVPQKYPGKRHYKGPNKGQFSGNPLGKNPGDVWSIPNVKSKHKEKYGHPCQFPVAIPQRLIRALTKPGAVVFDPFAGVASTGIAASLELRRFIGSEIDASYAKLAIKRHQEVLGGTIDVRRWDMPALVPDKSQSVAKKPPHFGRPEDGAIA